MANTTTPHLGLVKPEVNADDNQWGTDLNGDLDTLDTWAAGVDTKFTNAPGNATTTDIWAGTDSAKRVTPAPLLSSAAYQVLTDSATIVWDTTQGFNAQVTLGGNRALQSPGGLHAGLAYILLIIQDGTGSRTLSFPSTFDFGGVGIPTLSTAAGAIDVLSLICIDPGTASGHTSRLRAVFSRGT